MEEKEEMENLSLMKGGNVVIDRIVLNTGAIRVKKLKGDHFIELQLIIYAHHRAIEDYNKKGSDLVTFEKGVESLLEIGRYYDYVYNDFDEIKVPYTETNTQKSYITKEIIKFLEKEDEGRIRKLVENIHNFWPTGFWYMANFLKRGKRANDRMTKLKIDFEKLHPNKETFDPLFESISQHNTVQDYLKCKYGPWVNDFFTIIDNFISTITMLIPITIKRGTFERGGPELVKWIQDVDDRHLTDVDPNKNKKYGN